MKTLIEFENEGDLLQRTNYFDLPQAQKGEFFLTWNAGAARMLVPDVQKHLLHEMRSAHHVEMIQYKDRINIMFDDGGPSPFCIVIDNAQVDFVQTEPGSDIPFSVYIRLGEKYRFNSDLKIESKKAENRGGARDGSGAKPRDGVKRATVTVRLPADIVEKLKLGGKTKMIETALREHYKW